MNNKSRDVFIDAAKGIAIISFVIGHVSWNLDFYGITIQIGRFV